MNKIFTVLLTVILLLPVIAGEQALSQSSEEIIREKSIPFETPADLDPLLDEIDDQRLVLMGEASHGTSEFYIWRAELSKRLIEEKGYNFIAVEGDWPAMARINEYVKHKERAPESIDAAMAFIDRWPLWMWRNQEVKELLVWLHEYNKDLEPGERVGFYGIDLYAKRDAIRNVISFLEGYDRTLASRAERTYRCMTRYRDVREYLQMVSRSGESCSEEMQRVLQMVRQSGAFKEGGWKAFDAEHNAILAVNAEEHYLGNLRGGAVSWNARATHFYVTAERLLEYYGDGSRGIIWAHNTHIGDARATDMARQGSVNIGQLARENLGREQVYAIGFGTYTGRVLAARQWEGRIEAMETPPGRNGSWEAMLEATGKEQLYLLLKDEELAGALQSPLPHRAIGVTYNPMQERANYVNTVIPDRYDAFIFFRETGVLDVLD